MLGATGCQSNEGLRPIATRPEPCRRTPRGRGPRPGACRDRARGSAPTAGTTCEATGAFGADIDLRRRRQRRHLGPGRQRPDLAAATATTTSTASSATTASSARPVSDAILGDRGGMVNQYLNAADVAARRSRSTLTSPPKEAFTGFPRGDYDRRTDLLHDVDGDQWIGTSTDGTPCRTTASTRAARPDPGRTGRRQHPRAASATTSSTATAAVTIVFGGDGDGRALGRQGLRPDARRSDARLPDAAASSTRRHAAPTTGSSTTSSAASGESDPAKQDVLGSDIIDLRPARHLHAGHGVHARALAADDRPRRRSPRRPVPRGSR